MTDQAENETLHLARQLCVRHPDLIGPDGFSVIQLQRRLGLSFAGASDVLKQGLAAGLFERHPIHAHRAVIVTGRRKPV